MKRENETIRNIVVPRTPKKAFNPNRRPSGLIQAQIQHLEAAAGIDPARVRGRTAARTEGESADYIARLTALIKERKGTASAPQRPMTQPPVPIAGTPTPTSTTRHGAAAASRPAASTAPGRPPTAARTRAPAKRRSTKSRASGSVKAARRTKRNPASSRGRSRR